MDHFIRNTATAFAFYVLVCSPGFAQDFDAGVRAFQTGDVNAALSHWQPLAAEGDARAQAALGRLHEYGRGVRRSDAEAARWYARAAAQGLAYAQYRLGVLHDNGWGVPVDDAAAVHWYKKAAANGHGLAQHDLAFMYADGTGITQSYVHAYMWLQIAVAQGNGIMVKHLARIAKKLTVVQIGEARALADDWLSGHRQ